MGVHHRLLSNPQHKYHSWYHHYPPLNYSHSTSFTCKQRIYVHRSSPIQSPSSFPTSPHRMISIFCDHWLIIVSEKHNHSAKVITPTTFIEKKLSQQWKSHFQNTTNLNMRETEKHKEKKKGDGIAKVNGV